MEPLRYCHRKWCLSSGFRSQSTCPRSLLLFLRCATPPVSRSAVSRGSFLAACYRYLFFPYRPAGRTLTTAHFQRAFLSSLMVSSLKTSARPISNDNLYTSLRFQRRPIYLLVFQGSQGTLFLWWVSRLDAFSVYPVRTSLPSCALGRTTVAPVVRPFRSSRTRNSATHDSFAHDG